MVEKRKRAREPPKREFGHIHYLSPEDAAALDKLRNDLEDTILRAKRIKDAFTRELQKKLPHSNRAKLVNQSLLDVHVHLECAQQVLEHQVSKTLCWKPTKSKSEESLKR
jgi:isochorismate hydrolase